MPSKTDNRSYKNLKIRIENAVHAFAMLGVHLESTSKEIDTARRLLAQQFHPDVNGASYATDLMARINTAYDNIYDPAARKKYVRSLSLKKCPACDGKGYTFKMKGFTTRDIARCLMCEGAGGVLKIATKGDDK